MNCSTLLKQPSASLPMTISFAALTTVLAHVVMFSVALEADEGTAVHIFQPLIIAEIPIVAFFAIKGLPRIPKQTIQVLALQVCAALAELAPVFFLNLASPLSRLYDVERHTPSVFSEQSGKLC